MVLKTFFFMLLVLKLNCSFPKIYYQKCNIILRVFQFLFVCFMLLFVFCFLLVFFLFFSFGLFIVILLFCDKHYVSHRLHTKLINATSHCRHHEKSRREHLFHPFLTFHISNPVIPMFIIFVDLKRREKQHLIIYYSKIGLGTFCSHIMKIKYFFGFCLFSICPFQILNSLKTTF